MKNKLKKESFIIKLFIKIACLLTVIMLIIGGSIYSYAYDIMIGEVANFSQVALKQVGDEIGTVVMDAVYLSERLAYNHTIINELKSDRTDSDEQQIAGIVENIIEDYMWLKNQHHKRLYEIYISTPDGVVYSSEKNDYFEVEEIVSLKDKPDTIIRETKKNPAGKGIYQYTFQIHKKVSDHLTEQTLGYITLDITEKILYDCYARLIEPTRNYMIVDDEGVILSAKDKRKIGKLYEEELPKQLQKRFVVEGGLTYKHEAEEKGIFYNRIEGTEWYLIEEADLQAIIMPLNNIKIYIVVSSICFIILSICLLKEAASKLLEPVYHIKNQMKKVEEGDLEAYITEMRLDEFGQISESFNEMLDQINELMIEVKQTEQKKRLAELDFLRAQINPHFIYNTLSSIRFFVEMEKNKEAEEMLIYFSKILRATLSNSNEFIFVRDEIETIKNYIGLQKLRYAGSFEVIYDLAEDVMEKKIPNFILQPIIENAIFYNIQNVGKPCEIRISGRLTQEYLELKVMDNGIGMSEERIQQVLSKGNRINSIGLKNINERIKLNYGQIYGLDILSQEGEGAQVLIKLPR